MQTNYREEYFRKYAGQLFEKYKKTCDYEYQLSILLPDFSLIPEALRESAKDAVIKMTAKRVADTAKSELLKTKRMITEIKEGRAALGFISKTQEISEWHDINEGFEFSCYMLSQFMKKYNLK